MTDASLPARVAQLDKLVNVDVASRMDRLEGSIRDVMAHREQEQRFQAACAALTGLIAFGNHSLSYHGVACEAREYADNLLAELSKTAPAPQPPEPEPVENSAGPTIDLESVVFDIFRLVEPVSSDDHSDAEMTRVLEQVRALVDKTLGRQPPEPRLVVSGLEIDGLIGRLRETTDMLQGAVEKLSYPGGDVPMDDFKRAVSQNNQLIIDLRAAVERQNETPEPVEVPNVMGIDGPHKLGSAISAVCEVVDAVCGDLPTLGDDVKRRSLKQIRTIVDDALGPPPADGLVEACKRLVDLLVNRTKAGEDHVYEAISGAEAAITAYEQERERAKEGGDG